MLNIIKLFENKMANNPIVVIEIAANAWSLTLCGGLMDKYILANNDVVKNNENKAVTSAKLTCK
jgi:hypothetical protein